jgi:hypothetical protein
VRTDKSAHLSPPCRDPKIFPLVIGMPAAQIAALYAEINSGQPTDSEHESRNHLQDARVAGPANRAKAILLSD